MAKYNYLEGPIFDDPLRDFDLPYERVQNETNNGYHARYMFTANDAVRYNG